MAPQRGSQVRGRAGRLAVLAAGAALLAACVPPPPPPPPPQPVAGYCAASVPNSAPSYQAAFDALRHTYTEWASADESVAANLPDGRVVWIFDDTSVGHVFADGTLDPSNSLVHNSFVVQDGACFTPLMGGVPLARTSLIPNPGPSVWYWPTSAVVDPATDQLRVFALRVEKTGGASLDLSVLDTEVATFSLPSLAFVGLQPLPFPTNTFAFGSSSFDDTTNPAQPEVYLYVQNNCNTYVARAAADQVLSGPWTFWNGSAWVALSDPTQAAPVDWIGLPSSYAPPSGLSSLLCTAASPPPGNGPRAQPGVIAYGSSYLLTSKLADAFTNDVSVFTGPSPAGPWSYVNQIADTTLTNTIAYGAYTTLTLPGTSGPVTVYNTNVSPFVSNPPPSTIQTYGPHFVVPDPAVFPKP